MNKVFAFKFTDLRPLLDSRTVIKSELQLHKIAKAFSSITDFVNLKTKVETEDQLEIRDRRETKQLSPGVSDRILTYLQGMYGRYKKDLAEINKETLGVYNMVVVDKMLSAEEDNEIQRILKVSLKLNHVALLTILLLPTVFDSRNPAGNA